MVFGTVDGPWLGYPAVTVADDVYTSWWVPLTRLVLIKVGGVS